MNIMYRPNNNALVEYLLFRQQKHYKFPLQKISRKNINKFIHKLRNGNTCFIMPDQDLGRRSSIFIPFFGQLTATTPSVSVCANIAKAHVLMINCFIDDEEYVCEITPPLENFPTKDKVADTILINQLIEQQIKKHPEQYLWMHRRFKTRPNINDPLLY